MNHLVNLEVLQCTGLFHPRFNGAHMATSAANLDSAHGPLKPARGPKRYFEQTIGVVTADLCRSQGV